MHGLHPASTASRVGAEAVSSHMPGEATNDPFVTRLRMLTGLDDADLGALVGLYGDKRIVRARVELVAQGGQPRRVHILLEGWACRCRLLPNGHRQITQVLLPGDICDIDALRLRTSDFMVMTLTPCSVVALDHEQLRDLALERPDIGDALAWLGAVETAMLAERNACLGRLSAREHLAHLLCELLVRLTVVDRAAGNRFVLPMTQEEIADVLGLTSVHVNRVLQSLRTDRLIEQRSHHLMIHDWHTLRREAGFRPDYLHLEGLDGRALDASAPLWAFAAVPEHAPF